MYTFGSILVVIGVVALLDNFGILPGNFWDFFWPALLVLVGLSFVSRSRCRKCRWNPWTRCAECDEKKA
jgi:hypothetical protein